MLGDALFNRGLLHREADIRQAELLGIGQRRILCHQIDARRVDRLAMDRNRVRQAERIHARLGVAVRNTAMLQRDALNAAGKIDRPGNRVRRGRVDLVDDRNFCLGQVLVPAELFQHRLA